MAEWSLPDWWEAFDSVHALNMALGLVRERLLAIRNHPDDWPGETDLACQVWEKVEAALKALLAGLVS